MKLSRFDRGVAKMMASAKSGSAPRGDISDEKKEALQRGRLAGLPVCMADEAVTRECKFVRFLDEQQRCGAASFCKVSCPHLGKVEAPPAAVVEEEKERKRVTLIVEPPPEF